MYYNGRISYPDRAGYIYICTLDTFLKERTNYMYVTTDYTSGRIMISVHAQ